MKWVDRNFQPPAPFVGLFTNAKKFRQACIKIGCKEVPLYPETSAARTWFMRNPKGEVVAFVCLNAAKIKKYSILEVYALLCHEAVHVWQEWASDIGEDKPGAEQEAYAVQWISLKLMNAWEGLK